MSSADRRSVLYERRLGWDRRERRRRGQEDESGVINYRAGRGRGGAEVRGMALLMGGWVGGWKVGGSMHG